MKLFLLGATGLLGQAMVAEAGRRGLKTICVARSGADRALDIADDGSLKAALEAETPDLVVNCAALVDVQRCEEDPGLAYRVNARPLALLAAWSRRTGGQLIHISTDHYYLEGGDHPHREDEPVAFANEYARSKYAGDAFALTAPGALVLRTSIVGVRGWDKPTFAEWAIRAVEAGEPMTLFADAFTSSIDVGTFAKAAFDLVPAGATGTVNLAAGEVFSKAAFVQEVARQLGRTLNKATIGSVASLKPCRAASLGLDVSRAEGYLGYRLPPMPAVVAAVIERYREVWVKA